MVRHEETMLVFQVFFRRFYYPWLQGILTLLLIISILLASFFLACSSGDEKRCLIANIKIVVSTLNALG